jgi:hypothetical protein
METTKQFVRTMGTHLVGSQDSSAMLGGPTDVLPMEGINGMFHSYWGTNCRTFSTTICLNFRSLSPAQTCEFSTEKQNIGTVHVPRWIFFIEHIDSWFWCYWVSIALDETQYHCHTSFTWRWNLTQRQVPINFWETTIWRSSTITSSPGAMNSPFNLPSQWRSLAVWASPGGTGELLRSPGCGAMATLPRDSLVARMLQRGTLPAWNLFDKAAGNGGSNHQFSWTHGDFEVRKKSR